MPALARKRKPTRPRGSAAGGGRGRRFFEPRVGSLDGGGRPLPASQRSFFEPRFGRDLGGVRIHDGARAAAAAAEIDARAFTTGRDVVFGAGEYAPETARGRRLLAHELTHVVQQTGTGGRARIQRKKKGTYDKIMALTHAGRRARRNPGDRVEMLINGSEIVYRMIDLYQPALRGRVSGVSYDPRVGTIRAESSGRGTVSFVVGREFILGTSLLRLPARRSELATAITRWQSQVQVGPGESELFEARVSNILDRVMKSPKAGLRLLYSRVLASSVPIVIRSITADASTWHVKEQRMDPEDRPSASGRRSHTDPSDTKRRGAARTTPTAATIFINPYRIKKGHSSYDRGTFVHELVHALDSATGRYNASVEIRERRAVFFQNMWREVEGKRLRSDYHDKFDTLDYQNAVAADRAGRTAHGVNAVTAYLLSHDNLPPTP